MAKKQILRLNASLALLWKYKESRAGGAKYLMHLDEELKKTTWPPANVSLFKPHGFQSPAARNLQLQ